VLQEVINKSYNLKINVIKSVYGEVNNLHLFSME